MLSTLKNTVSEYLYRKYNYSFSQCGEDVMLAHMLRMPKGTYVDVGAFHPVKSSNTYLFYRKGWSGINIDAAPGSMELFRKLRPRDINLEVAVGEHSGEELPFYFLGEGNQRNSFSKDTLEKLGSEATGSQVIMKTRRLDEIFSQYLPTGEIHFMSIDVEGLELNVLRSNDWEKYRPWVILLEAFDRINDNHNYDIDLRTYLKEKGYQLFSKFPLGVIFVREDLPIGSTNYIDR